MAIKGFPALLDDRVHVQVAVCARQEKGEGCVCELAKRDKLYVADEWSNRAAVFGQWCFNYGIHESSMTWLQSCIYIYRAPIGITKERERERKGEDVENEKKIRIQSGILEMRGRKGRKASLPRGES